MLQSQDVMRENTYNNVKIILNCKSGKSKLYIIRWSTLSKKQQITTEHVSQTKVILDPRRLSIRRC